MEFKGTSCIQWTILLDGELYEGAALETPRIFISDKKRVVI